MSSTSTFVVRPGVDRFEFAHTSLLEFFLARYLMRALVEGRHHRGDDLPAGEHAGLGRVQPDVGGDRLDLRRDDLGRDLAQADLLAAQHILLLVPQDASPERRDSLRRAAEELLGPGTSTYQDDALTSDDLDRFFGDGAGELGRR